MRVRFVRYDDFSKKEEGDTKGTTVPVTNPSTVTLTSHLRGPEGRSRVFWSCFYRTRMDDSTSTGVLSPSGRPSRGPVVRSPGCPWGRPMSSTNGRQTLYLDLLFPFSSFLSSVNFWGIREKKKPE